MEYYEQYELSKRLANSVYSLDVLNHVHEVSNKCVSFKLKTIAILHDIIEDTLITTSLLRHYGFDDDIVQSVCCITRINTETYFEYIQRLKQHEQVRQVKLIDLQLNIERCKQNPKGSLITRYQKALKILQE